MKPPGVLVNGRAGRVLRHPEIVEAIRALLPPTHVRVTHATDEIPAALDALRDAEIDTLMIVGGDGSVTGSLTPLLQRWPHECLPNLLLAAGGTVSTVAKSLGGGERPERLLARLLDGVQARVSLRPPLRLRIEDEPERFGMMFVAGAPVRFLEFYYERSRQGVWGAMHSLSAAVGSIALSGRLAQELFRESEVEILVDGQPEPPERSTILLASAVRDVGLGFKPFYTAGLHADRFHWLATNIGGRSLAWRLPWIRLAPQRALAGIPQAAARTVELQSRLPLAYSIDADFYPARRRFRIEAGPTLRFLAF